MTRRVLASLALILGLGAAFAGTPRTIDVDALAKQIAREEDHVTAIELARWIEERKPGLRIINVGRASELESLTRKHLAKDETIVLVSDGGAHAAQAWVLLRVRGVRNVFFLRGGLQEWEEDVLRAPEQKELSRYFGGDRRNGC